MIETLSQTAKAFRDTTIMRSSGVWLDAVTRQWGVPHLATVPEADWRNAVRETALASRGIARPVFQFVRWALAQFDVTVSVTVDPADPQRLTAAAGAPFVQSHIGALVERQDTLEVHSIAAPADIVTSAGAWVELLADSVLPFHTGASFGAVDAFDVKILPFTIREEPGRVIISVSDLSVSSSPATYLQPESAAAAAPGAINQTPGSEGDAYNGGAMNPAPNAAPLVGADTRPAGEPFGGHLQADEINQVGDPLGVGPHPPYLSSGAVFDELQQILDGLLVAGVTCVFERRAV